MKPHCLFKWTNWFFGFGWGGDSFSLALGPLCLSWDR